MKYPDLYIRMMDISLNLARVGNWTADNYDGKKALILRFLVQTEQYLEELLNLPVSSEVKPTLERFTKVFHELRNESIENSNKYDWAERALTWANILQHRAKLA